LCWAGEALFVARALSLAPPGQPIPPATAEPGRRWWVEDRDTATAFKLMRSGDLGLPSYFGSLRGVDENALLARDDLRPVAALMQAKTANLLRGLLRR